MAASDTYIVGSNGKAVIPKDPDATLDYAFDWTLYLADISDTISAATFVLDPSLTQVRSAFNALTATVWVSGGVAPTDPSVPNQLAVTCRITTAGGRIDDRSVFLKIQPR